MTLIEKILQTRSQIICDLQQSTIYWKVFQQLADGRLFPPSAARFPSTIMLATGVSMKFP